MVFRALVLSIFTLSLTACNISGSGQKGPFNAGSNVSVSQLNSQASPIASTTLNSQVTGTQGNYSVDRIGWDGWTEVKVEGTYFDEFTGANGASSLALNAITRKDRTFDTANVHLFSHLAAARMQQRVADGQNNNQAWRSTQQEMKDFFGFQRVSQNYQRGVEQLSILAGTGSYRRDNANLLLFTGSFLATGGNAASLQLLTDDFADDAQFNGTGASAFNAIAIKGGATGLLTTLSNNLKSRGANNPPNTGDMPSLPKWVIVDAGDVTAPVISVLGDNPVEIEAGTPYEDAGATATDDVDEVVEVVVVDNSDVIDTTVAGTYTVTYQATDAANNSSTKSRTVNVIPVVDTIAPVITVTGQNPVTIVVGTPYVDEGATAIDAVDGEVAANAINSSDVIDTTATGTYTVTYQATDAANNSSIATRTVEVVEAPDNTPPEITLLGDNPDTVEVDTGEVPQPYQDPGFSASDDRDESVSVDVSGSVDTSRLGTYVLTYTATDVAGNDAIPVERTVNVVDTIAPVITLLGANPHEIIVDNGEVPAPYEDLGATVSDNYDAELAYTVDLSVVKTDIEGIYTLIYTAVDSSGNEAVAVEREVRINPAPNEVPTVNAGDDVSVLINTPVTLTGVGEDTDGTITYSWTENGVEISTVPSFDYTPTTGGAHTLTLTVTDNDNATASDDIIVTATLPAPYQIVFVNDTTIVPRNLDANLFSSGLLFHVSVVDGNGITIEAEPTFDPSVVDLSTPGSYPMVFSFIDPIGREITKTLTVIVENRAPIATSARITVDEDSNDNPITLLARDSDLGDTLTYTVVQPSNGTVTGTAPNVTYTPNPDYAGSDSFTFTVSDGLAESTGTINITVTDIAEPDNIAPIITLIGEASVSVVEGGVYTEQGATASDDHDGNLTASIVVGGDTVNTNSEPGTTFTVTYNVSDAAGNPATTVTRTVIVTEAPDTIAPVITIGNATVNLVQGTAFVDDVSATDDRDGAITENIVITGSVDINEVGTYVLTYNVSDAAGNPAVTVTRTVNVTDATVPVITLIGDANVEVEAGTSYTDAGATASDDVDGDISSNIVTGGSVDVNVPDTYEITFDVKDAANNSAVQVIRTVVVKDTIAPVITLNGEAAISLVEGSSYSDAGAVAIDSFDGDLTANIVKGGDTVDTTTPGVYTITYDVIDNAQNAATQVRRTVTITQIADTTAPSILINGGNETIVIGSEYVDAGATATDDRDESVTVTSTGEVDVNTVGTYKITYSSTDNAGNTATLDRIVLVVFADQYASEVVDFSSEYRPSPGIWSAEQVLGVSDTFIYGDNVTAWAPATQNGGLEYITVRFPKAAYSTGVTIRESFGNGFVYQVDVLDLQGDLHTVWTGTDPSEPVDIVDFLVQWEETEYPVIGVKVYIDTSTVGWEEIDSIRLHGRDVEPDTTAPTITLVGDAAVTVANGGTYAEQGATAFDDRDGNITTSIVVGGDTVNTNSEPGTTFTITYNVSDAAGNPATQVTRTVTIAEVPDTTAPTITLVGNASVSVVEGGVYTEQGATAQDDRDGNITASIVVGGDTVNTNSEPDTTFEITYNVSDAAGNPAAQVTRTVTITAIPDITAPNITLIGDALVSVVEGGIYVEQGALARDDRDGNVTDNLVIGGDTVNTNAEPGTTFTITYNVSDAAGNPAVQVTRTVVITALNQEPVAIAEVRGGNIVGDKIEFIQGQIAIIDGIESYDIDGQIEDYRWAVSGNSNYSNASSFEFDTTNAVLGDITFTLTVTDDQGAEDTTSVTITVLPSPSAPAEMTFNFDLPLQIEAGTYNNVADLYEFIESQISVFQANGAPFVDTDGEYHFDFYSERDSDGEELDPTVASTGTIGIDYLDDFGGGIYGEVQIIITEPVVVGYSCSATVASEGDYSDSYIANATDDRPWSLTSGSITVQDIEDEFNAARLNDANGVRGQKLKMPSQAIWDAYTDSEKALYLINSERCARGIRPYEGIAPEVVASPAQTYAQYLADNDVFSHTADGRDPWQRLTDDAGVVVGGNADFFSRGENLAFVSRASTVAFPVIHEAVSRSIYGYIYDDKDDTTNPDTGIASYGHRAFVLATGLIENSGVENSEGLIGIGKAEAQSTFVFNGSDFNQTKVYSVMNGFDPNGNWDMSNVQTVSLVGPEACLVGYSIFTDNSGAIICLPADQ